MNALVTMRFRVSNVCGPDDLESSGWTLREMVAYLIQEEGLSSIVDDPEAAEIVDVVEVP